MLFALLCTDKPDSVDLRMAVRPDHLKYLESLGTSLKAAGPFTTSMRSISDAAMSLSGDTDWREETPVGELPLNMRFS